MSPVHQPRTLLMAAKACSGVWSTEIVVVKSFIVCLLSFLNKFLQTVECFVPPLRDVLQVAPRRFHLFGLEFPDALAAATHIRDETRSGDYVHVRRPGRARDGGSGDQPRDQEWPTGAHRGNEREPGFVTER